jgi:transcriptional regulator
MYNYPQYKEKNREELISFMRQHPFITLIGNERNGRIALTQIPVLIEERGDRIFLLGHVANKSDHHHAYAENPEVLALFTGPHTYVSGSWYSGNPHQASTWNYVSVHARGTLRFTDESGLIGLLKRMTLHFEDNDTSSTTVYDNLPEEYLNKLRHAIVGFEVEVMELENVYKLSQNRDEKSYDNIISELQHLDPDAKKVAEWMKKRKDSIFPR